MLRSAFFITLLSLGLSLSAQTQKFEALIDVLKKYEAEYGLSFSFDADFLQGITIQSTATSEQNLEQFLDQLQVSFPLAVSKVSETYYSISPKAAWYNLTLSDSISGELIPPEFVVIVRNGKPLPLKREKGAISFQYKPNKSDTLYAMAYGFENHLIPYKQLKKRDLPPLSLHPEIQQLLEVTVRDYLTEGINLNPQTQSIDINVSQLPLLPGETDGDIFASIGALPGISNPDGRAGNIFIRGSSTDQSLILYDNIPIYHRGHYFGTISPYNPMVVDEVKVYRNGFNAKMGDRVGAAVEVNTNTEVSDENHFGVGTNTLYGMGFAGVKSKNGKVGLVAGARKSYPYSFDSPKLQAISDMIFQASAIIDTAGNLRENIQAQFDDYLIRVIAQPSINHKLSVTGLYSRSGLEYGRANARETNLTDNYGANLEWNWQISPKLGSNTLLTFSNYTSDFSVKSDQPNNARNNALNEIKDFNIRQSFHSKLSSKSDLEYGASLVQQNVFYAYSSRNDQDNEQIRITETRKAYTASPFMTYEWKGSGKFYLSLGGRLNYYSLLDNWRVSPRLFANWYPTEQLTIKGSAGYYYQYLSQVKTLEFSNGGFDNELWLMADNVNNKILGGIQTMFGGLYQWKSWILDVEGYHKEAENVAYYSSHNFTGKDFFLFGKQYMCGVDLMLKKRINENLEGWVSYSASKSEIALDSAKDYRYNSQFSQPQNFKIGANWTKNQFKCSIGWRYATGQYSDSFRIIMARRTHERAISNRPPNAPAVDNPFEDLPEQYPAVHHLDISASYVIPETNHRHFKTSFGLSLINVYNQKNLIDNVVRAGAQAPSLLERYAIGFAPNLMVNLIW
jgi:hypothetical protein